jgi:hypothetical protein
MYINGLTYDFPHTRDDYDRLLEVDDTDDDATEIRTILRERSPRPPENV